MVQCRLNIYSIFSSLHDPMIYSTVPHPSWICAYFSCSRRNKSVHLAKSAQLSPEIPFFYPQFTPFNLSDASFSSSHSKTLPSFFSLPLITPSSHLLKNPHPSFPPPPPLPPSPCCIADLGVGHCVRYPFFPFHFMSGGSGRL